MLKNEKYTIDIISYDVINVPQHLFVTRMSFSRWPPQILYINYMYNLYFEVYSMYTPSPFGVVSKCLIYDAAVCVCFASFFFYVLRVLSGSGAKREKTPSCCMSYHALEKTPYCCMSCHTLELQRSPRDWLIPCGGLKCPPAFVICM